MPLGGEVFDGVSVHIVRLVSVDTMSTCDWSFPGSAMTVAPPRRSVTAAQKLRESQGKASATT